MGIFDEAIGLGKGGKFSEQIRATYDAVAGRGMDPRAAAEAGIKIPFGAKAAQFMKGPYGPFLALLLAQLGGGMAIGKHHQLAQMGIQQEALERQGEAMDPQALYYQAMMPQYEQQEEMSRMALMQTLMGGGQRLAQGQEMFGGV